FANEPPLLEELGINVEHIMAKTYAVLNPLHVTHPDVAGDSDLAGPLVFCLAFGSFLLLCGKLHFNYIYGIGFLGCISMYGLISMMSSHHPGLLHSTHRHAQRDQCYILPSGFVGNIITGGAVLWCAASASNLFVTAFRMEHQQVLMAYPCSLLYAVFALITIF
ncbi:Protein YIPF, partial [Caligus rogercresseyi]